MIDVVTEIAEQIDLGDGRRMSASQFLQHFLFTPETQHSFVARLSGGERRRLYLCTVLMRNPNFLILDEPTNDLDIVTLGMLEEYLRAFKGCVIVVSHDRYFVDKVADHLLVFCGGGEVKGFHGHLLGIRGVETRIRSRTPRAGGAGPAQAAGGADAGGGRRAAQTLVQRKARAGGAGAGDSGAGSRKKRRWRSRFRQVRSEWTS